jgi:hypothetical protein
MRPRLPHQLNGIKHVEAPSASPPTIRQAKQWYVPSGPPPRYIPRQILHLYQRGAKPTPLLINRAPHESRYMLSTLWSLAPSMPTCFLHSSRSMSRHPASASDIPNPISEYEGTQNAPCDRDGPVFRWLLKIPQLPRPRARRGASRVGARSLMSFGRSRSTFRLRRAVSPRRGLDAVPLPSPYTPQIPTTLDSPTKPSSARAAVQIKREVGSRVPSR